MLKTQNKSSIVISKVAFLDDMLPELHIENLADYGENPHYNLSGRDKFLELIKKLAAKVLTEDELVTILGDCHGYGRNGISYSPSKEGEKEPIEKYVQDLRNTADISDFTN